MHEEQEFHLKNYLVGHCLKSRLFTYLKCDVQHGYVYTGMFTDNVESLTSALVPFLSSTNKKYTCIGNMKLLSSVTLWLPGEVVLNTYAEEFALIVLSRKLLKESSTIFTQLLGYCVPQQKIVTSQGVNIHSGGLKTKRRSRALYFERTQARAISSLNRW